MRNTILSIISVFWILVALYLVYEFGIGIATWQWKQFFLALVVMVTLSIAAIVVAALLTAKKE